jgi:hypothetical protein
MAVHFLRRGDVSLPVRFCVAVYLSFLVACGKQVPDVGPNAEQASDTSIVTRALDTTRFQWRRIDTPRATIYAAASVPDRSVTPFVDSVEAVISDHLAFLGAAMVGKHRLFLVRSRDEIEPLTGSRAPGWSETGSGSAYFVVTDSVRIGLRHEVMHLLSWRLWGRPAAYWMSEGLASASVPACGGIPIGAVAPMFDRAGMLIPLETLRTNFTFSGDSGAVFYLQSADLVRFIDRTYGREKLRAMWSNGGLANARNTLGVDVDKLERSWRSSVAASPAPAWPGWPAWRPQINMLGCS